MRPLARPRFVSRALPARFTLFASAAALAVTIGCGAPSAATVERSTVVVPPQPAQPVPPPPPSVPVAAPSAAPLFRCEGGKRFEVLQTSYCAYAEPDTWERSEARCVANGGHLMTVDPRITSDALHAALGSPLGAERAAWIGLELKSKGAKKAWTWTTGAALEDASWNTGEPNNFGGHEACAEWLVADGRWNDTRCELSQSYLCQAAKDKPLACKSGRAFSSGGVAYCLNAVDRTFAEAKRACAADGGGLAVLGTLAENRAVRDAMAARFAATRMWIGLTEAGEDGNWRWTSGVPYFEFAAWEVGEPNNFNNEEHCAELHAATWMWNDLDCGVALPSVCESTRR
jgi:hypothetical protein